MLCKYLQIILATLMVMFAPQIIIYAGNSNTIPKELSQQRVNSYMWVSTSAEYQALCHQAYNSATLQLEKAITESQDDRPMAIITDCDSTILTDVSFVAFMINENKKYNSKDWEKWISQHDAVPVPGAIDFFSMAAKKNCEIFYVSNRKSETEFIGTMRNLKNAGFPNVDKKHLLLMTDSSNKQLRFDTIAKDYNILMYVGDNLDDMPINTRKLPVSIRRECAEFNKDLFGIKYIVLPNPMYGSWETAIKLTPVLKDEELLDKPWRDKCF